MARDNDERATVERMVLVLRANNRVDIMEMGTRNRTFVCKSQRIIASRLFEVLVCVRLMYIKNGAYISFW